VPGPSGGERPPFAAYVDESVSGDGRLYTMTAALVDTRGARELVRGLQEHADLDTRTGKSYFHTVAASEDRITAMTEFIAGAAAVRSVMTARAPVPARGQEDARQACLAELVARAAAYGATSMTLDGRTARGPRPQVSNDIDRATIQRVREAGLAPANFMARHVDDRDAPLVWIADVVGWQARRAIEYREPARLAPLAGVLAMYEARLVLPDAVDPQKRREGRGARIHGPSPTPTSSGGRTREPPVPGAGVPTASVPARGRPSQGLQAHLDVIRALAAQARAQAEARRGGPVDAPRLAQVVDQLEQRLADAQGKARRVAPLDRFVTNPREAARRPQQDRPIRRDDPPRSEPRRGPRQES
jgi:hypothetical protein